MSDATPNAHTTSNAPIYAMAFGNFAAGISSLIVAGISSEMSAELNVSLGRIGLLVTIFALAYGLGAPIVAALTGNVDRRALLIIGQLFVLVGNGLVAIAPTYLVAFLARIVSALGSATYVPLAALVAISLAKPAEKGRVSAIVFTGFTVSTAFGVPLGTYVGINFGWRLSFTAVVGLALIAVILIRLTVPTHIKTPIADPSTFRNVFRDYVLTSFLAVTILQFAGQMALFAFIAPWLQALTTLGATGIALMLVLSGLGGIAGNIITGRTTDRFGARETQLVLIILLIMVMLPMPIIGQNLFLGSVLIFIWGFVGQGFVSPQLVRIVNANPALSSASLSLNTTFLNLGLALGAFVGGLFVDSLGVASLTWVASSVSVLSLLVFGLSWWLENASNNSL
ncbi:MAG: MFS transporter [Chloroflexota bacterium]